MSQEVLVEASKDALVVALENASKEVFKGQFKARYRFSNTWKTLLAPKDKKLLYYVKSACAFSPVLYSCHFFLYTLTYSRT